MKRKAMKRECLNCTWSAWSGNCLTCVNEDSDEYKRYVMPGDLCDEFMRYIGAGDESENMGALK